MAAWRTAKGCGPGFQELGLFREEHPVLLAGHVHRAGSLNRLGLTRPTWDYRQQPFWEHAVLVTEVITIENKTTFHSEAKRLTRRQGTSDLYGGHAFSSFGEQCTGVFWRTCR